MREREIEAKLVRAVEAAGGFAPKLVSPGMDGMPDRIVLLPGGRMCFVELKAPGKLPRPIQNWRIGQLRTLGFQVYVIDSVDKIADAIEGARHA